MKAVLQLIRFPNLVIIAITQYLFRHGVIEPVAELSGTSLAMSHPDFFLLVLSTVLIAAAGYAINDYFDTRIDKINKPNRVVVGTTVNRKFVMLLHIIMNVAAFLIGIYLAWKLGRFKLALVQPVAAAALWFYSVDLKHRFLLGNLVIAGLAFTVPFLPALYELPLIEQALRSEGATGLIENILFINYMAIGYGIFAFLTNLVREVIKDMEDVEGDAAFGSKTIPVTVGMAVAKWVAGIILLFTAGLLVVMVMWPQYESKDFKSLAYFFLAVFVPLVICLGGLIVAREKKHYSRLSLWIKGAMLGGILSMLVFWATV